MTIQTRVLIGGDFCYLDNSEMEKLNAALLNYPRWVELGEYLNEKYPIKMSNYRSMIRKRLPLMSEVLRELDLGFIFIMSDFNFGVAQYAMFNPTLEITDYVKWNYFRIKYEL